MTWVTMHMAVGMGSAAALATAACTITRKGWRWLPLAMTAGAAWAMIPDVPQLIRQDLHMVPFIHRFATPAIENFLNEYGNFFFFHKALNAQPREYALHGLFLMLLFYNLGILLLMARENRQRKRAASFQAHASSIAKSNQQLGELNHAADNINASLSNLITQTHTTNQPTQPAQPQTTTQQTLAKKT